ncbi:GNAT family N-acetyltransferase [Pseudaminobacter sp. 19-2017]|uniref:GNAT family N-acetyltransferase n=1 Tax=Pseudaminobacter soli (ex Zhang et al. 2022) TaxID=2831468 RepID=A0A942E7Q5_9HYPH|nr:GNAT family N-acetyltransferase [Pseudaminobacter soli]MBS3652481.1 GNAT family N-acetyltransferase [Pseudaminobacter soli]
MILLRTPRLVLRNWEERDRSLFHRINSDEQVMEFFPFRRDRATSDAVMDRMRADIEAQGYGWTAVEVLETGECAGFVGLRPIEVDGIGGPGAHEIGWRLAPEFWGKGYVTEAASGLLDFAFTRLGLDAVLSFAVSNNERSIAVMRRLGMKRRGEFDHPGVPDTHPELKHHHLYAMTSHAWRERATPA